MTPEQRADAVMDAFSKADLASGARTVLLTLITEAVRAAERDGFNRGTRAGSVLSNQVLVKSTP